MLRESFGIVAWLFLCIQINDIPMETKQKVLYEAPSTMVFEVRQEGVICASGGEYPQWNDENI